MECHGCRETGGNKNPVFPCDVYGHRICKQCSQLTSSEVKVMDLKDRKMKFYCTKCENFETHTLLKETIEDKVRIIAAKDEIIEMLRKKLNELEKNDLSPSLYSQVLQKNKIHKTTVPINNIPSVIIKPKLHQNINKTNLEVKQTIKPAELKVAIRNTRNTKDGSIIVKCNNKSDIDTLKKVAENKLKNYDVQITKMRKPRFKILGYQSDLDKEHITHAIKEQNSFMEESDDIKITYIRTSKKSSAMDTVFGECSPEVFHKLMGEKKIFIDWQRYSVVEDLTVPRCFKCQQYYHKMESCPNAIVCEHCSEEHHINECPKLNKKCKNCFVANEKYKQNYNILHKASDINCPSYHIRPF